MLLHGTKKRESPRFHVPVPLQKMILAKQENRCVYCGNEFGSFVKRRIHVEAVTLEWDHFVPYSYSAIHSSENIVASCRICNQIKGSKVFDSVEQASQHIRRRRSVLGYEGESPLEGASDSFRSAKFFGESNGRSSITEDIVRQIRADYENGDKTYDLLVEKYGLARSTIWQIVKRKTWRHVE